MRAVSYVRVSSDQQLDNFSLEAQQRACARLIEERGWALVGSYSDEGYSAATTERPGFQRMLAAARAGAFDVLVVHKLDRFSRSVTDLLLTLRALEQDGVSVVSATEQFDFTTPIGRVMLTMLAAFAEWYLSNLSAEVAKGKKARAMAGYHSSRVPYGYVKDEATGVGVPHERDSRGYLLMVELAETGEYSLRQIAETLDSRGFRPAGRAGSRSLPRWSADTVRSVLRNPFYVGTVQHKGTRYPGLHEALITQERWERVQAIFRERQRVPAFKARRHTRFYLLSGLVRCATCGEPMRGEYKTDNADKEYRYYRCASRMRARVCEGRTYVRADWVEGEVEAHLLRFAEPEEWRSAVEATARRLLDEGTAPTLDPIGQRDRLQAERARLTELYQFGDITRAKYLRERDRITAALAALDPAQQERRTSEAVTLVTTLPEAWQVATPQERKRLVREIVAQVVVGAETVAVTVREEYAPFFED